MTTTTTTIFAAGYIVQDNDGIAIYGYGLTADEAWAMVVDGVRHFHNRVGDDVTAEEARHTQFKTLPASANLLALVADRGGAIAWGMVGGIACTCEEEEA